MVVVSMLRRFASMGRSFSITDSSNSSTVTDSSQGHTDSNNNNDNSSNKFSSTDSSNSNTVTGSSQGHTDSNDNSNKDRQKCKVEKAEDKDGHGNCRILDNSREVASRHGRGVGKNLEGAKPHRIFSKCKEGTGRSPEQGKPQEEGWPQGPPLTRRRID